MSKCSYPIETFIKVHLNNGILMKKVGILGKRKQYKIEMMVFTTRFWSIRLTTFLVYQQVVQYQSPLVKVLVLLLLLVLLLVHILIVLKKVPFCLWLNWILLDTQYGLWTFFYPTWYYSSSVSSLEFFTKELNVTRLFFLLSPTFESVIL